MASVQQVLLIAKLVLELLAYADELRELLKRIEAGEDISDEEIMDGLESVRVKVAAAHALRKKKEENTVTIDSTDEPSDTDSSEEKEEDIT